MQRINFEPESEDAITPFNVVGLFESDSGACRSPLSIGAVTQGTVSMVNCLFTMENGVK